MNYGYGTGSGRSTSDGKFVDPAIFDLIDRRYNKEGSYNIIFTSNKNPSAWRDNFNEDDALLCALDRIYDDATVFTIKGNSFRGNELETISLQTTRVKAPTSSERPTL